MNRQLIHSILAAIMYLAAVAGAQEPSVNSSDPNELFNSMMQTMPDAMKNRVDSASSVQRSPKDNQTATAPAQAGKFGATNITDAKQASLDDLPEPVREQVRKTMRELETESAGRMVQFKEMQNRNDGK